MDGNPDAGRAVCAVPELGDMRVLWCWPPLEHHTLMRGRPVSAPCRVLAALMGVAAAGLPGRFCRWQLFRVLR